MISLQCTAVVQLVVEQVVQELVLEFEVAEAVERLAVEQAFG